MSRYYVQKKTICYCECFLCFLCLSFAIIFIYCGFGNPTLVCNLLVRNKYNFVFLFNQFSYTSHRKNIQGTCFNLLKFKHLEQFNISEQKHKQIVLTPTSVAVTLYKLSGSISRKWLTPHDKCSMS